MELINNKVNLENILEDCEGCVIYGAGLVGTCIVQYLIKEKLSSKVICVAVKSKEKNPSAIMGIEVCELSELESYKEKYVFLIATLEHLHKGIKKELEEFGCKRMAGISNACYAEIREQVNDFTPDILCAIQKGMANIYDSMSLLYKKIDEIRYGLSYELSLLIEEQNEIRDVNTKAFAGYQNCYYGKDVVIVATGPTLNDYQPIEGAIHIGVNTAYKNPGIALDYLFAQDGRDEYLKSGKFEGIENTGCKIFMGRLSKRAQSEYMEFPETYRLKENVKDYILDHAWTEERIYRDICSHPVSGGYSVTFSALHFALYTYPKRIYLVGCDNAPTGYYDGTVEKNCLIENETAERLKEHFLEMKRFAQMHYPETEIISVNPVGLKGVFKDRYIK